MYCVLRLSSRDLGARRKPCTVSGNESHHTHIQPGMKIKVRTKVPDDIDKL